ncbi:MAG: GNAT family protein [Chloroflexota bacterium]
MRFPVQVDQGVELRPFAPADAEALFDLISRNRQRLDPWMRWTAPITTLEATQQLIQRFTERLANNDGFHVGLWVSGESGEELAGGVACYAINPDSHYTEIGYWLGEEFVGRGLVTRACRLVISELFAHQGVHRIEIQAVTDNLPSRAVAERLGFTFEGVRREFIWITDAYKDHALYSLLVHEWQP